MQGKTTTIPAAPVRGLLYLSLAGAASVGGFFLLTGTHEIVLWLFGLCLLLVFPGYLILLLIYGFGGRGPCPICDAQIEILTGTESFKLCESCGEYLEAKNRVVGQMDPNFLSVSPLFGLLTPWDDLRAVRSKTIAMSFEDFAHDKIWTRHDKLRTLEADWPAECCVCGGRPTRYETVANELSHGQNREVQVIAKGIPHCDQHQGGVKLDKFNFADSYRLGVLFRSYAYRNKFRRRNAWAWPSQAVTPPETDGEARVIVSCPNGHQLRVPRGRSGTIRCPTCKEPFAATT